MDRRGAPPPPHLDVNKRSLLPPLRLAREIGLVLASKHPIRLDHPLAFRARVGSAGEPRRRVPSGSSGTSLNLEIPTLKCRASSARAVSSYASTSERLRRSDRRAGDPR